MSEWELMSREQLLAVVVAQDARAVEQDARIEALTAQVAELTARLGQNSGNSSLPPSPVRQAQAGPPDGVGADAGKQPGAPGAGLALVADPDEVVEHVPVACTACGAGLEHAEDVAVLVRQVRDVAAGWVSAQVARAAGALAEVEALVKAMIVASLVIGVDETTVNIAGVKAWLHVARTDLLTAYHLHTSRGRKAVDEFGVLPGYAGTVVHDALSVYDGAKYATAAHSLCGAHLLRELTAVAQQHPDAAWPAQARRALADLNTLARTARENHLSAIPVELAAEPLRLFRHAVLVGLAERPRAPGRKTVQGAEPARTPARPR